MAENRNGELQKAKSRSVTRFFGSNKNPYGIALKSCRLIDLPQVLGMENDHSYFDTILNDLKRLQEMYLDPTKTPGKQIDKLKLIEEKLEQMYFGVYKHEEEGSKRMLYTLCVICSMHLNHRSRRRKDIRDIADKERNMKLRSLSLNTNENGPHRSNAALNRPSGKIFYIGVPRRNRPVVPSASQDNNCTNQSAVNPGVASRHTSASPHMYPRATNNIRQPVQHYMPQNIQSAEDSISSQMVASGSVAQRDQDLDLATSDVHHSYLPQALHETSGRIGDLSYHATPKHSSNQFHEESADLPSFTCKSSTGNFAAVHRFLSTCQPPMTAYLRRFLEFGCMSEEYLRGVSGWRPERRNKLLKKMLYDESEMDLAVLENQFETYFA